MSARQHQRRPTRRAPTPRSAPTTANANRSPAGGLSQLLADAQREVLAVTFWVPDGRPAGATSGTVRMRGRWHGDGRPEGRDTFTAEERIDHLPRGIGSFTITKVVSGVAPGDWTVTGDLVVDRPRGAPGPHRGVPDRPIPLKPAGLSWRRWQPVPTTGDQRTTSPVLARRPAALTGAWPALVVLGIVVALVVQAILAGRVDLPKGRVLAASGLAVVLGGVGAKVWYLAQRRPGATWNGWCIQGFVLAFAMGSLVVVLADADRPDGPLFAAALGLYTIGRQRLLRLRGEPRRSTTGTTLTTIGAAAVAVAAVVVLLAR